MNSPLKLVLKAPSSIAVGAPLDIAVRLLLNGGAISGFKPQAGMLAPQCGLDRLKAELRDQLKRVEPRKVSEGEIVPDTIARLVTLRDQQLAQGKTDLFATATRWVALRPNAPVDARSFSGRIATSERGTHNVTVTVTGSTPDVGR